MISDASSTCMRWLQYCRWMTIATSRFSFPVVRGRGLPATLLPTPVSSVRASLRCPLASGCWLLKERSTQSHHWVAAASQRTVYCTDTDTSFKRHDTITKSVSHSPDPLSVCIKQRRPLWDAEDGVIVSSILIIEVRGVEEVEALQGTLHCQTEAGWAAPVTRQSTLWRGRKK